MVRPLHGRYLAGVCAAVGRATNTDPVLWRVLAAVLTLFGGVGLLLYLLGWLLIPEEGDTASPIEALAGRGRSSTSPVTVVVVAVLAVLIFLFVVADGFRVAVLGVVAVLAVLLLLLQRIAPARPGPGGAPAGGVGAPPAGGVGGPPAGPPPAGPPPGGTPPAGPPPGVPSPPTPPPTGGYPPPPPGGYRPAFAPHGPYASFPPPPVPPAWRPQPPTPPRPPKPPRERSRLTGIVLSLMCLALGVLVAFDLTVGSVQTSAYFATALAVVGLGLVVGAWLGRARWLIALGVVLAMLLGFVSAVEGSDRLRRVPESHWRPQSVAELSPTYQVDFGDVTVDLRDIDFARESEPVSLQVVMDFGRLQVILPPDVDADVTAQIDFGDANVLGRHWGGIDPPTRRIQDDGPDGAGGGSLILDTRIDAGNLEVLR